MVSKSRVLRHTPKKKKKEGFVRQFYTVHCSFSMGQRRQNGGGTKSNTGCHACAQKSRFFCACGKIKKNVKVKKIFLLLLFTIKPFLLSKKDFVDFPELYES